MNQLFLSVLSGLIFLTTGIAQTAPEKSPDSLCLIQRHLVELKGTWLLEAGYSMNGKKIYIKQNSLPVIYSYSKDGFSSLADTGYVFLTDQSVLEKYGCSTLKPADYYTDFNETLIANKTRIDSLKIKGTKKKMRKNFGSQNVFFVYYRFPATILYFEDPDYGSDIRTAHDYYDFNNKTTTLITVGNHPSRYIISIRIN